MAQQSHGLLLGIPAVSVVLDGCSVPNPGAAPCVGIVEVGVEVLFVVTR